MTTPALFTPFALGGLSLPNRIVVAPMCQYSADGAGNATDWHTIHLGGLAQSGAALLILEASAVVPEGRISPDDLGLYSDANEAALRGVLASVRRHAPMALGIQLAHAGRKASTMVPWAGNAQIAPDAPHGWQTVAPSTSTYAPGEHPPVALDDAGLDRVRDGFVAAARRADRLGLDLIEVHAAHGYLLHEFLSPLSNFRDDRYGGSLDNRMRFPLEVFAAVRAAFPKDKPVGIRVSATDWADGGWDVAQTVAFARAIEACGGDYIHVSSAGLTSVQKISVGPGYQVPFARAVKAAVGIPVIAVGLITDYEQAEAIVGTGDADAIALARTILFDPRWPWHAAAHLGAKVHAPKQYLRSQPRRYKDLFG